MIVRKGIGQGDRKGRLYHDTAIKEETFIVEATLAVAFLATTTIIHQAWN